MPAPIRGSEAAYRLKKVTTFGETPVAGAYTKARFYSHTLQPGQGVVDDPELGGNRHNQIDPSKPTLALPNPSLQLVTALDLRSIGVYLTSMWGAPVTTTVEDTTKQHVWNSGGVDIGYVTLEFPTGDLFLVGDAVVFTQASIPLADEDGSRKITWDGIPRSVRTLAATLSASLVDAPDVQKLAATLGVLKVDDVNLGNILGGTMTMGNGGGFDRYGMDDSAWPGAVEKGLTAQPSFSIAPQLRLRRSQLTFLQSLDGSTDHTIEAFYQLSETASLSIKCNGALAAPVSPSVAGVGALDVTPTFQGYQTDADDMLTITLINDVTGY